MGVRLEFCHYNGLLLLPTTEVFGSYHVANKQENRLAVLLINICARAFSSFCGLIQKVSPLCFTINIFLSNLFWWI